MTYTITVPGPNGLETVTTEHRYWPPEHWALDREHALVYVGPYEEIEWLPEGIPVERP